MKQIHIIFIITALTMLVSCSQSLKTQLEGSWKLSDSFIYNLDSIAEVKSAQQCTQLKATYQQVVAELDSCKVEPRHSELMKSKSELSTMIERFSPENIKQMFLDEQKKLINNFVFVFGSDGSLVVRLSVDNQDNRGTWKVSNDTIHTLFDNQPAEILIVKSITFGELELVSPPIDETGVTLLLKFDRE